MRGGDTSGGSVVNADKIRLQVVESPIDQHEGLRLAAHAAEKLRIRARGGDDERIQAAGQEMANLAGFERRVLLRGGHNQRVALAYDRFRKCLRDLRKEGVDQPRDDETDQIAATGNQAAGQDIGLIIQFFDALEDPFAGLLADVGMVAEHF